ncbi:OmpA family protein [Zhengella mangrovi]|nr:OmpA family protein [Zhengella mangrovi]
MKRLILLATASTLTLATPALAGSPADTLRDSAAPLLLAQNNAIEIRNPDLVDEKQKPDEKAPKRAKDEAKQEKQAEQARQPDRSGDTADVRAKDTPKKTDDAGQQAEEKRQKAEDRADRKAEDARQKAEEKRQRAEDRAERKADDARQQAEEKRQQAEKSAEQKRQRAEDRAERKADDARQQAEEKRQRAEKSAEQKRQRAEDRAARQEQDLRRQADRKDEQADDRRKAERRDRDSGERRQRAGDDAAPRDRDEAGNRRDRERDGQRREAGREDGGDRNAREDGRRRDRRDDRVRLDEPVAPIDRESGERVRDGRNFHVRSGWRDQRGSREVGRFEDRTVIRLGNGRLVVERRDGRDERLRRQGGEVEIERLKHGRIRETVRRGRFQIVTIYSRDGDILRRSRIGPNGRERVLLYVPRDRWDDMPTGRDRWDHDYGLPPIRVTIPRDRYIWAPRDARPQAYYDFLEQPPVERAERLYSVDEVRYSDRLRAKLPRIDLETVNFAFGSAEIRRQDVDELQSLAEAMNRILEQNPSETFLIEGHTDAVGTETANLALSDKRAENVAIALTDVFEIPPENLVTQGYGESDLKVQTEEPSAANRRVTVRRITPLVTPDNTASIE